MALAPGLDGLDNSPLLRGHAALPERGLYWETYEPSFWQAVRAGRWKAVRPADSDQIQLFDLSVDPSEARDVAADQCAIAVRPFG